MGEQQRIESKRLRFEAMRELVEYPDLGNARDDLYAGCRNRPAGRHILYYQVEDEVEDEEIVIVRVLHARQDATVELSEP